MILPLLSHVGCAAEMAGNKNMMTVIASKQVLLKAALFITNPPSHMRTFARRLDSLLTIVFKSK